MELTNDIKLQLINGVPTYVKGIGNVYPLTMLEIAMCVESKYNTVIGFLTRTLNDLDVDTNKAIKDGLSYYDFFMFTCLKEDIVRVQVEEILSKILRKPVSMEKDKGCFFIGDKTKEVDSDKVKLIDRDTFDDLADVLRFQNCIEKNTKVKKQKPKNSKVEMLKKKRAKGRQLLQEAKGEDFSMADIQSTLGVFYCDLQKVSNMTVYQVNDQYNKFMRQEKYDRQYDSYLAGADPKKLELSTHWSAKQIKKDMDNIAPPN